MFLPTLYTQLVLRPMRLQNLSWIHSLIYCCFLFFLSLPQPLYCFFSLPYFATTIMSALIGWSSFYVTTTPLDIKQVWCPVLWLPLCGTLARSLFKSLRYLSSVAEQTHPDLGGAGLWHLRCLKQCEQGFKLRTRSVSPTLRFCLSCVFLAVGNWSN